MRPLDKSSRPMAAGAPTSVDGAASGAKGDRTWMAVGSKVGCCVLGSAAHQWMFAPSAVGTGFVDVAGTSIAATCGLQGLSIRYVSDSNAPLTPPARSGSMFGSLSSRRRAACCARLADLGPPAHDQRGVNTNLYAGKLNRRRTSTPNDHQHPRNTQSSLRLRGYTLSV